MQPPTTFEETVERLGTAIRLGLLPPGTRLPPERELAEELSISRSTLRQALTTLVQSGHLVSRARPLGRHVRGRGAPAQPGDRRIRRSGDEARAVLDYRVVVETGATVLAAERADEDDLDRPAPAHRGHDPHPGERASRSTGGPTCASTSGLRRRAIRPGSWSR